MADSQASIRHRLRSTFESAAGRYHQARPRYPEDLYTELIRAARLPARGRLLEIGCATGVATIPLAERGYQITCLEPGAELAATARRNLAPFGTEVVRTTFEDWEPAPAQPFDLVYAATAWHWIDPEVRYQLAWRALAPGGALAIWSAFHVHPADGDPIFEQLQQVYDEIGEGVPGGWRPIRPGELPDERSGIAASGLFDVRLIRHFDWEISYTADGYIALLDTFSGHIEMAPWQRDRLYGEIRRLLAARPDGRLRRHWGAVLNVARRRDEPPAG